MSHARLWLAQIACAVLSLTHLPALQAQIPNGPISGPSEIVLHAQLKALAQQLSLQETASYQQRRGEQRNGYSGVSNSGVRLFHQNLTLDWQGDLYSKFDGQLNGLQLNKNLYVGPSCRGSQELGLFAGSSRVTGDGAGRFPGEELFDAGRIELASYYGGLYFSDYRHDLSYIDALAKVSWVAADTRSARGVGGRVTGPQLTLSAERGFVLPLTERLSIEPQLQVIANYTNFSAYQSRTDYVDTDKTPEVSFRAGLRGYPSERWRDLYLFTNVWHTLDGDDEVTLRDQSRLRIARGANWGEIGGGLTLLEASMGSVFLNLVYRRSLDDHAWDGGAANLGFNWNW